MLVLVCSPSFQNRTRRKGCVQVDDPPPFVSQPTEAANPRGCAASANGLYRLVAYVVSAHNAKEGYSRRFHLAKDVMQEHSPGKPRWLARDTSGVNLSTTRVERHVPALHSHITLWHACTCMQCDRLTRGGAYVENMCGSKEMQSELEARLQKEREGNFHGAAE
jgi:hypothetical protein